MSASAQHGIELVFPTVLLIQCSNTVLEVTVLNTVFAVYEAQSVITQFFAHLTFALICRLFSITYFKRKS
jgi:hypothetical protein